jgi:hypothetical protein
MTNQAWLDKSLTTASGSWAELRHATVLYAKQSYTSTTGMSCPNSICFPQGYVEPNPDVFSRLAAMTLFMKSGFDSVGLSSMLPVAKLTSLSALCVELSDIAAQELGNGRLSISQYCDIAAAYKNLSSVEDFSQYQVPPSTSTTRGADSSTACIVDVHTDPNSSQVLEVGEGKPMCLYVIVPVEGKLQVCRGAMFSYYEFLHPMSDRMTDAEWQTMLASSKPAMPSWIQEFSIGSDQAIYKNTGEDLNTILSTNDSVPATFLPGDSVVIRLQSDTIPTISVESKGSSQIFIGNGISQVVIPSSALGDTNILTINSRIRGAAGMSLDCFRPPEISISYHRELIRSGKDALAAIRQPLLSVTHPLLRANRLLLPPNTSWRVIDTRGRQIAFINSGTHEWAPSARFAHLQLFLVPVNAAAQKPMRFIIGN